MHILDQFIEPEKHTVDHTFEYTRWMSRGVWREGEVEVEFFHKDSVVHFSIEDREGNVEKVDL